MHFHRKGRSENTLPNILIYMKKKEQKKDLPRGRKNGLGMRLFACALLGGLLADPLAAQSLKTDDSPTTRAEQAVTVTGVVLDAMDDSPMIGVNVLVVNSKGEGKKWHRHCH